MCTTCTPAIDPTKMNAFGEKMLAALNGASIALMTSIGHRTGLFDTMADGAARTSKDLAQKAELNERYVREWLGAMVTGGVVEHCSETHTYSLPAEHAAMLTRAASPNNIAVTAQWIALLGSVEGHVVDAFNHGRGVPYSAYGSRFHEVMAEESAQTAVAALFEHILPIVPGLPDRLAEGIDVLDIACGGGRAICTMAEAYPNSRFRGYDTSAEAIELARDEAARRGLTNALFEVRDVAEPLGAFDLVTGFDAVHDQAKPEVVLRNVRESLAPGGVFLMQDILASSAVERNVENPLGPLIYTISTMHCMSVSLANGGPGLGAAWGKELALRMLADAGFGDVKVQTLPHDILNYYYVARPGR